MSKFEDLLDKEKDRVNDLIVPGEMEDRLRSALDDIPKKKKNNFKIKVASIILAFILLSYNMDTLAYYGKKLMGFESVMNGTLQELNEMGKGQLIDKSYTFKNGVKVTVDGIMLDDNNMVLFYTISSPYGNVMDVDSDLRINITGFGEIPIVFGGQGHANEDFTELKWVVSTHKLPKFFEKTISFNIAYNNDEKATIQFKLDRTEAVGKSIRIPIKKEVKLDQRNIKLESLTASPITTVIKGQIQNIVELGIDYINKERFRPETLEISLIADGNEVLKQESSMSTDMKGINFEVTYDALPEGTKKIQLKLTSFGGDHDTNELIKLEKGNTANFDILDQEIEIEKIYESEGNTYITFTTEDNVYLSRVYLNVDGQRYELKETISGDYEKIVIDDEAIIKFTRTMRFEGIGEKLELDIQRIRYAKDYDMIIWEHE